MAWAKLDDNFHAHPKTYAVGLEGCGLFAKSLSYCAHYLTDGFLPAEWVYAQVPATSRNRDKNDIVARMLDAELFREVAGGFVIDDYLECNPSREEVQARQADISAKRSQAGKRGAASRHGKRSGKTVGKPLANGRAERWQNAGPVPVPTPKEEQLSTVEVQRRAELAVIDGGAAHVEPDPSVRRIR